MYVPIINKTNMIQGGEFDDINEAAKNAGIVDRRRAINLFVLPYKNGDYNECNVLVMNIVVVKSQNVIFHQNIRRVNGVISYVYIYALTGMLPVLNTAFESDTTMYERFRQGIFRVTECKRIKRQLDEDNKAIFHDREDTFLYSKMFQDWERNDHLGLNNEYYVPRPQFYTPEYEGEMTGETRGMTHDDITESFSETFAGYELIDDKTEVYLRNPQEYTSMKDKLFTDRTIVPYTGDDDLNNVGKDILCNVNDMLNLDTFVGGGYIIYDTELGVKHKDNIVLCSKYMPKFNIMSELEEVSNVFCITCNEMADRYGSLSAVYAPSPFGSKIKIRFKDYNDLVIDGKDLTMSGNVKNSDLSASHEISEVIGDSINYGIPNSGPYIHKSFKGAEGLDFSSDDNP